MTRISQHRGLTMYTENEERLPTPINVTKLFDFLDWSCYAEWAWYDKEQTKRALLVRDNADGQVIAKASLNMPKLKPTVNEVIIKDYAENAGVMDALVHAGVIEPSHLSVKERHVIVHICRVAQSETI